MSEGRLAASDVWPFVGCSVDFRRCCAAAQSRTLWVMSWLRGWWAQTAPMAMLGPSDSARPDTVGPRTARDWLVDAGAFVIAVALGALILRVTVHDTANAM